MTNYDNSAAEAMKLAGIPATSIRGLPMTAGGSAWPNHPGTPRVGLENLEQFFTPRNNNPQVNLNRNVIEGMTKGLDPYQPALVSNNANPLLQQTPPPQTSLHLVKQSAYDQGVKEAMDKFAALVPHVRAGQISMTRSIAAPPGTTFGTHGVTPNPVQGPVEAPTMMGNVATGLNDMYQQNKHWINPAAAGAASMGAANMIFGGGDDKQRDPQKAH